MLEKTSVLERVEIVEKEDLFEEKELANQAADVLGYNLLKTSIKQGFSSSKLRKTLKELDIRPFSIESVRKYKDSALRKANNRHNRLISVMKVGLPLLISGVLAMMIIAGLKDAHVLVPSLAIAFCAVWFLFSVAVTGIPYSFLLMSEERMLVWEKDLIKDYNRPIPEFALQTALDIKEKLPEASFYIEELRTPKKIDPFLIVEYGKEVFYLEVWNEPGFDKVRVE